MWKPEGLYYLRWRADGADHLLNKLDAHLFTAGLAMRQGHVLEERRMSDKGSVTVTHDVRSPFELGRIGVSGANVLVLQRLELLCGAELVGLRRDQSALVVDVSVMICIPLCAIATARWTVLIVMAEGGDRRAEKEVQYCRIYL